HLSVLTSPCISSPVDCLAWPALTSEEENSALATSAGDRIAARRSAMRKGSASWAAHGERAPVSWAKSLWPILAVRESLNCALGSTAIHIAGSNPSRSATISAFDITYEFYFLGVKFSPLSRGLWRMHF